MESRATPDRLFAGVCVATVGTETRIDTGGAGRAELHLRHEAARRLARALLDDPSVQKHAKIAVTPSLLRDGAELCWLLPGPAAEATVERGRTDAYTEVVLAEAGATFRPFPAVVRALVRAGEGALDAHDAVELLLGLVDAGLLLCDLRPALIGPPALEGLRARVPVIPSTARLRARLEALALCVGPKGRVGSGGARPLDEPGLASHIREAAALANQLVEGRGQEGPSEGGSLREPMPLGATLVLEPTEATVDRTVLERAAGIAEVVFRLQDAISSAWERVASFALDETVATLLEVHEPGPFHLAGLAHGRYAAIPGAVEPPPIATDLPATAPPGTSASALPLSIVQLLWDGLREDPSLGPAEIRLRSSDLREKLPDCDLPATTELWLAPMREGAGEAPGTGWLYGLHGPAGGSLGRFAHALGEPLADAIRELVEIEAAESPDGTPALDLEFSPGDAVADVAAHPALRPAALALSGWPAEGAALAVAALDLVLHPPLAALGVKGAPLGLGLRERASGAPLELGPLQRIRPATIADAGVHRLLAGFGLLRASRPWALDLAARLGLARQPRVTLDGFVLEPASFRVEPDVLEAARRGDAGPLVAWRKERGVPRHVLAGEGDALLGLDLDALCAVATDGDTGTDDEMKRALVEFARLCAAEARVFEAWPPPGSTVDRGGRRIELIACLVKKGREDESNATVSDEDGVRAGAPVPRGLGYPAGAIVDPRPDPDWQTLVLYGAPDRADRVLAAAIAPVLADHPVGAGRRTRARSDASAATEPGWFFLRYVDPAGRHQLRVRVRGSMDARGKIIGRLRERLGPLVAAGDVTGIDLVEYRPERLRYGGERLRPLAEAVFQSDSALVCALLGLPDERRPSGAELLVRSLDALGAGLGLDLETRATLSTEARHARHGTLEAMQAAAGGAEAGRRHGPAGADPLAGMYRALQRVLLAGLASDDREAAGLVGDLDPVAAIFFAHRQRLAEVAKRARAARLLPALRRCLPDFLHLAAVRLAGPDALREASGVYLWQRALEGRVARARAARSAPRRRGSTDGAP